LWVYHGSNISPLWLDQLPNYGNNWIFDIWLLAWVTSFSYCRIFIHPIYLRLPVVAWIILLRYGLWRVRHIVLCRLLLFHWLLLFILIYLIVVFRCISHNVIDGIRTIWKRWKLYQEKSHDFPPKYYDCLFFKHYPVITSKSINL